MTFDMITTVRIPNSRSYELSKLCLDKRYTFTFVAETVDDYHKVVIGASDLTPAAAEAFVQMCMRYNVPLV